MDKVKQWKPGQLVTVNGIVCRVVKNSRCIYCPLFLHGKLCDEICRSGPNQRLRGKLYLKELKER